MEVRVKVNYKGVGEILNSPWAKSICEEAAAEVAASQPGLVVMPARHTGQRVAVTVASEREDNGLLKALGGRHD